MCLVGKVGMSHDEKQLFPNTLLYRRMNHRQTTTYYWWLLIMAFFFFFFAFWQCVQALLYQVSRKPAVYCLLCYRLSSSTTASWSLLILVVGLGPLKSPPVCRAVPRGGRGPSRLANCPLVFVDPCALFVLPPPPPFSPIGPKGNFFIKFYSNLFILKFHIRLSWKRLHVETGPKRV